MKIKHLTNAIKLEEFLECSKRLHELGQLIKKYRQDILQYQNDFSFNFKIYSKKFFDALKTYRYISNRTSLPHLANVFIYRCDYNESKNVFNITSLRFVDGKICPRDGETEYVMRRSWTFDKINEKFMSKKYSIENDMIFSTDEEIEMFENALKEIIKYEH